MLITLLINYIVIPNNYVRVPLRIRNISLSFPYLSSWYVIISYYVVTFWFEMSSLYLKKIQQLHFNIRLTSSVIVFVITFVLLNVSFTGTKAYTITSLHYKRISSANFLVL